MPSEPAVPATPAANRWPELDDLERRVLGVLVEKQKTTPDAYPLSLNALVTGCNQKSNRDPVMDVDDLEAEATLTGLKEKGLVIRVQGAGRVERWRHGLYEAWQVDKVELAILAELLLRGGQTEGELRGRVSRMEPVEDLDALRAILEKLAARRLVVYLTPPGQRGTRLTHGFYPPAELAALRRGAESMASSAPPEPTSAAPRAPAAAPPDDLRRSLAQAQAELAEYRDRVSRLEQALATLQQEVSTLKQALGA